MDRHVAATRALEACDVPVHASMLALLEARAARQPRAVAIGAPGGQSLSYEALLSRVASLSAQLRAYGVARDSRVAIVLPNGPDMAVTLLSVGCTAVAIPLNPAYRRGEYGDYLTQLQVGFLVVEEGAETAAAQVAREIGARVLRLSRSGESLALAAGSLAPETCCADSPRPQDVALILLTSGSTGSAKRVPLTHRNLCTSARDVCRSLSLGEGDRCLCMWEQHHIGGVVDLLLAPLASGGSVVCAGGFDAARFYELLGSAAPTWFQGVPTTLHDLLVRGRSRAAALDRSSLRFIRSVAAALPPTLMAELERTFGVPVVQTYGMTEAAPLITSTRLPPAPRKPGSTGRSCGAHVAIMSGDGTPVRAGESGEIAVRGDNVFAGYEGDPEANAACFRDGWFYTGDIGALDEDGDLFLQGRVTERIHRGGEKVSPHEIERALLEHPSIAQAAAFGVPHPTLGEDIGAAIVLATGRTLTAAAVRAHVSERLAAFKVPRRVLFLSELPRCPVGKVRRRELAAAAAEDERSSEYVAPRNEIESFLAKLWAAQLDVARVGIDDEFGALGGDSLSSVRLLAATEELLGVRLPVGAAAQWNTVRRMAECIAEVAPSTHAPATELALHELHAALSRAAAGELAFPESVESLRARLEACRSVREFQSARESLLDYATPGELDAVVGRGLAARPGWHTGRALWDPDAWRLSRQRARWSRRTRGELDAPGVSLAWVRRRSSPNMWLYTWDRWAGADKVLVVGFCGAALRLMIPVSQILMHLDPSRCDVLMLRDPTRTHFEQGIPGTSADLRTLCEVLVDFAHRGGYRDVISLGTSAGGLGAICAALQNGWKRSIAVGADSPSRHPLIGGFLDRLACERGRREATEVVLVYGSSNPRDLAAADRIVELLPAARRRTQDGFAGHNVLHELQRRGELRPFLDACFA